MLHHRIFLFVSILFSFSVQGQDNPFTGSDNELIQNYNLSDFDRISILDLDGVTEIEVGKPFSVQTSIKDKYSPILEVRKNGRELIVTFKYTRENNKYIENPNIKVKISCPRLDSLYKRGNSDIIVSVSDQKFLAMSNEGNGSALLTGAVEQLSLRNDGNGRINATNLSADAVFVSSFGNGDLVLNAKHKLQVERNGNGRVIQTGNAKMDEIKR
jgi:hypothetical protein